MRSRYYRRKHPRWKKWLYDWAWLDLTVLPGGIALAYFLNNTYANGFWFNLSTELIGAYISVRFIDYLLKRTESRHSSRRGIARDINWFAKRANDLIPSFDENILVNMKAEIKNFDDRWKNKEEREKLLYEDEIIEVNKIRHGRKEIVWLAENYITSYKLLQKIERDISNQETTAPKWLRNLQESFYLYRATRIDARDHIRHPLMHASNELNLLLISGTETSEIINLFKRYVKAIEVLVNDREAFERKVQSHMDMDFKLQYSIYQEST